MESLAAVLNITASFYGILVCDAVSAAVMGTAMGLELSHKDSAFALCYKTIQGIQPSDLTQSQVDRIKALNGNVYVARGYTHFLLENGTMANG